MLGYRSTFAVDLDRSTTTRRDTVVRDVLREGFDWLRTQKNLSGVDALQPGVTHTFPSGHEVTFLRGDTGSDTEFAKLIALDPPRPGEQDRWATSLLVGVDHQDSRTPPMVAIDVDAPRDRTRPSLRIPQFTSRPRLALNILGAFSCEDHGFDLGDGPRLLDIGDVDELLTQLAETDHHGLVLLSGTDNTVNASTWRDRLEGVTRETVGQAAVFVLSPEATREFNHRVSAAHTVTPFGVRIFRPGALLDDPDDGRRHRAVTAQTMVVDSRIADLRRSFARVCREHANAVPLDRFLRRLDVVTAVRLDDVTGVSRPGIALVAASPASVPSPSPAPALPVPTFSSRDEGVPSASGPVAEDAAPGTVAHPDEQGLDQARAEVAALRAELDQAQAALRELQAELDAARAHAEESSTEVEGIRAQAEKNATERADASNAVIDALRKDLEDQECETALQAEEARALQDQLRTATYQLDQARQVLSDAKLDVSGSFAEPEANLYGDPLATWEDLRYLSADTFPHLRFGDDCWEGAEDLAAQDHMGQWARLTWDALVTLDEYARIHTAADAARGGGLREYLTGGAPAGAHLIPAGRLRANESQTVRGRTDWMRERRFHVPPDVNPAGAQWMLSHIVIQTRGSISPRLYFDDRTADLGTVVVGYIGPHLTNTKTH